MTSIDRSDADFETQLAAFAELSVARAVNLQRGQELIVSAPLEAAALVRHIARHAYARGCKSVTCLYEDPGLIRDHIVESDLDALDYAAEWMYRGLAEGLGAGAARLQIVGPYPDLLSGVSTDRIMRVHGALVQASRPVTQLLASAVINSSVVPFVTGSWARQVFPHAHDDEARRQLWTAVFDAARVVDADPLQAWDTHLGTINVRRATLQRHDFRSLRFFDATTDLRVDLADSHQWVGGTALVHGIATVQSVPTEEIFTALRGDGAHGRVLFSRPLALGGTVVEHLYAEFDRGLLTTVRADRGLEAFEQLIAGDAGARRLGEVGLVPASARIARTGLSFWNPLFDRHAASHVAFGQSPLAGAGRPGSANEGGGANQSAMHIDCALGHAAMQVDGVTRSGDVVPVMRDGAFVG
jgi:aminopeptidase